jgi:hypothetical protein
LARSYGGLGLLLLEGSDPARLPEAEDYLRQDLALALEIGDLAGLSKVRLWLAEARRLQGDAPGAAALLAEVAAQNQSPADRISAEAGLMAAAAAAGDRGAYLARAGALALLLRDQPIPAESRPVLRRALAWPEAADAADVMALRAWLERAR